MRVSMGAIVGLVVVWILGPAGALATPPPGQAPPGPEKAAEKRAPEKKVPQKRAPEKKAPEKRPTGKKTAEKRPAAKRPAAKKRATNKPSAASRRASGKKSATRTVKRSKRAKRSKRRVKQYHLTLRHVNTKEAHDNLWVIRTDPKRKNKQWVGKNAKSALTHFLRDWKSGQKRPIPERLIWYLYLVGQHFDAPIEVVSAYRHKERKSSRHKQGKAVDFRVDGVDPKVVWEYCKRFDNVGVGWYPNSKFVHLDVRDRSSYWIDDSGPGESARYRKGVPQKKQKGKKRKQPDAGHGEDDTVIAKRAGAAKSGAAKSGAAKAGAAGPGGGKSGRKQAGRGPTKVGATEP